MRTRKLTVNTGHAPTLPSIAGTITAAASMHTATATKIARTKTRAGVAGVLGDMVGTLPAYREPRPTASVRDFAVSDATAASTTPVRAHAVSASLTPDRTAAGWP